MWHSVGKEVKTEETNSLSNHSSQQHKLVNSSKPFRCQTPRVFDFLHEIPGHFHGCSFEGPKTAGSPGGS